MKYGYFDNPNREYVQPIKTSGKMDKLYRRADFEDMLIIPWFAHMRRSATNRIVKYIPKCRTPTSKAKHYTYD